MTDARQIALAGVVMLVIMTRVTHADDASFSSSPGLDHVGTGAEIYQHICQGCHMPNGEGAHGAGHYPALSGDPALFAWQYPALTVLGGRHGMPPFGLPAGDPQLEELRAVHLSDEQIASVVNYIRSHFGNTFADVVSVGQVAGLPHPAARLATNAAH